MPNAIACDYGSGANYWSRGGDLTGVSDGKAAWGQGWIKIPSLGGGGYVWGSALNRQRMQILSANNRFRFLFRAPDNSDVVDFQSATSLSAGVLYHFAWWFDVTGGNNANCGFWLDGVDDTGTIATFVDTAVDWTTGDWGVGARADGANTIDAELAAVGFWFESFDVGANINKLYRGGGQVDLGASGELPSGTAAALLINTDASDLNTKGSNLGTGGSGSVTGTLTAGTNPPDAPDLISGTADSDLPALTQQAEGKACFVGTAAQTLPAITQQAAGEAATDVGYSVLPALTQQAFGFNLYISLESAPVYPLVSEAGLEAGAHRREIARGANRAITGKTNNRAGVTLTPASDTTVVKNPLVSYASYIDFMPRTPSAALEYSSGQMFVSAVNEGEFTITHANSPDIGRSFLYVVVG